MAYHTNDKITDGLSRLDKIFAEAEKFSKAPPTEPQYNRSVTWDAS